MKGIDRNQTPLQRDGGQDREIHHGMKPVFLYTMTAGLGDMIVMSTLAESIEAAIPGSSVLFVHRGNPHTGLWTGDAGSGRFYNVFSGVELRKLAARLRACRAAGSTIFGLQMAPGSLQGFFFFSLLKRLGLLHYVVDFNLINADIITPPRGDYILDLHLNQVAELTRLPVPPQPCPVLPAGRKRSGKGRVIGLHPWSRRGHLESFVWQKEKWLELVRLLLSEYPDAEAVVFGKDDGFDSFRSFLQRELGTERVTFSASANVPQLIDTIGGLDLLVSVNTAVVHIGYLLATPTVILCGPSLDLWVPKGPSVRTVRDEEAIFQAPDSYVEDPGFGTIQRINVQQVANACRELLGAHEQ